MVRRSSTVNFGRIEHIQDRVTLVHGDLLDQLQRHDLENTLAEGLLTKTDRAAMGWALESRAPFLDKSVMEFAATLPPWERVHRLQTKAFLKRYALPFAYWNFMRKGIT